MRGAAIRRAHCAPPTQPTIDKLFSCLEPNCTYPTSRTSTGVPNPTTKDGLFLRVRSSYEGPSAGSPFGDRGRSSEQ
jgi:hypothetical protein